MSKIDWLSQLLKMITVTGQLEVRCSFGAPWRVSWEKSAAHEIPYHVVLKGRAIVEDLEQGTRKELVGGDIVLLPHGAAHVLHDGSGDESSTASLRHSAAGWMVSENRGQGERLDMLCGHFCIAPPHHRLIRDYLPVDLVVRALDKPSAENSLSASNHLAGLLTLMRMETIEDKPGAGAILDALTSALFALALRAGSEAEQAPVGLLALAGNPRLAPAISAMFSDPARAWSLPELAGLCSMSRATFMRHFQGNLGRSANELLLDIRMSLAANELNKPAATTEAVADSVGYRSVAAFRRAFTDKLGMTPGQWRRQAFAESKASTSR